MIRAPSPQGTPLGLAEQVHGHPKWLHDPQPGATTPSARATPSSEQQQVLLPQLLEHRGTAGHYRAPPEQKGQGCFRNSWNRGIWRLLFLVVHEDQVFSMI